MTKNPDLNDILCEINQALGFNPGAKGYLVDQPWNWYSNLPRIDRLDEIPEEVLR